MGFGMLAKGQRRVGSGKGRVEQAGFGPREERHKKWPSNVCGERESAGWVGGGCCLCNSGDQMCTSCTVNLECT